MESTPLQLLPALRVTFLCGQSFESRVEMEPSACAHETQRVPPIPRVVFVRPIVGRLEDLTTACLTTFNHSADTFVLNNEDGSLLAVPQLDPPHPCLHVTTDRESGKGTPLLGWFWESQAHTLGRSQDPPYSYNGKKGPKRGPLESKTMLKTQTRWDGKILCPVRISGRDATFPGG